MNRHKQESKRSFLSERSAQGQRPWVLGHRGASHDCPENTLLAFQEALRQGADGVELDVMRCGSGEVVVVHDDDLGRLSGPVGAGVEVRRTPLSVLRRYDVGQGQHIPTLDEVLEAMGDEPLVNIELKTEALYTTLDYARLLVDDGLADAVFAVLVRSGRLGDSGTTLVSSFDPFQLRRFWKASRGQFPLGFLFEARQSAWTRSLYRLPLLRLHAIHPQARALDAPSMRAWREKGLRVNTWTVDDPREVACAATLGVDGIITNRPAQTLSVLRTDWGNKE
jgi:glycerophosphoryl diester phosphodiesterase